MPECIPSAPTPWQPLPTPFLAVWHKGTNAVLMRLHATALSCCCHYHCHCCLSRSRSHILYFVFRISCFVFRIPYSVVAAAMSTEAEKATHSHTHRHNMESARQRRQTNEHILKHAAACICMPCCQSTNTSGARSEKIGNASFITQVWGI